MCSKDTEIEILRERVQEYRELLSMAYYMMRSPTHVSQAALENFINKLDEHQIIQASPAPKDPAKKYVGEG